MSGEKDNDEGPKGETIRGENDGTPRPPTPLLPRRSDVRSTTGRLDPAYENMQTIQLIPSIGLGPLIGACYSRDAQNDRRDPEMALTAVGLDDQRRPECRHDTNEDTRMSNRDCFFLCILVVVFIIGIVLLVFIHFGSSM